MAHCQIIFENLEIVLPGLNYQFSKLGLLRNVGIAEVFMKKMEELPEFGTLYNIDGL